jgi:hypothetical protein
LYPSKLTTRGKLKRCRTMGANWVRQRSYPVKQGRGAVLRCQCVGLSSRILPSSTKEVICDMSKVFENETRQQSDATLSRKRVCASRHHGYRAGTAAATTEILVKGAHRILSQTLGCLDPIVHQVYPWKPITASGESPVRVGDEMLIDFTSRPGILTPPSHSVIYCTLVIPFSFGLSLQRMQSLLELPYSLPCVFCLGSLTSVTFRQAIKVVSMNSPRLFRVF